MAETAPSTIMSLADSAGAIVNVNSMWVRNVLLLLRSRVRVSGAGPNLVGVVATGPDRVRVYVNHGSHRLGLDCVSAKSESRPASWRILANVGMVLATPVLTRSLPPAERDEFCDEAFELTPLINTDSNLHASSNAPDSDDAASYLLNDLAGDPTWDEASRTPLGEGRELLGYLVIDPGCVRVYVAGAVEPGSTVAFDLRIAEADGVPRAYPWFAAGQLAGILVGMNLETLRSMVQVTDGDCHSEYVADLRKWI